MKLSTLFGRVDATCSGVGFCDNMVFDGSSTVLDIGYTLVFASAGSSTALILSRDPLS